jgi:hypothetical protein
MALSEWADWWDQQRRESSETLGQWVEENPQWWAIGLATATATAMELGAGMVDALRLGEGVAEGGVGSVAKDALRMLVIVGPLGRALGTAGRLAQTSMIRLAVTTKGVTGPCTFTAVNNAASIAEGGARNFFLTAREAAQALGKPLSGLAKEGSRYKLAAWIDDLVPFLKARSVRIQNLGIPKTIEDVVATARTRNGVVVFAIEWTDAAAAVHRHSMIAVRTAGGVRFADYGGKFISSLAELASRGPNWKAVGGFRICSTSTKGSAVLFKGMEVIGALETYGKMVFEGGMLLLEGMHAIETVEEGVDLAVPVQPATAIERGSHEPEVIKQSFEAFKARKQGKPILRLPPIKIVGRRNGPPRSDWLTGVQYRLNAAGFGAGPVDGVNGPRTKKAVIEFQKAYGLAVDGIPGPKTQAKLVEVCGF